MQADRKPDRYAGMTTNERLFEAGLLDPFGAAARRRDQPAMIALLEQVELTSDEARWIAETVLANPARYGY